MRLAHLALVGAAAVAAPACRKPSGDLRDRVVSTDHYEETVGQGKAVGDVQVTFDVGGSASGGSGAEWRRGSNDPRRDRITLGFAAPASTFRDPRPLHFLEPPPQALLARSVCTFSVTSGNEAATVDPGQTCGGLRITRGKVWIESHVLQIELYGTTLDGAAYRFVFPIIIGSDYALPID